ncbi:Tfiih basal transcription factor complex p44 subunit, partial [Daphnia magna]
GFFKINRCSPFCAGYCTNRAVKHPTLHVLHKCENFICVQVGLLRLQRLMEKPNSSC